MTVSPLSQRPRWARLLGVGLVAAVCLGGVLAAVLVLVLTPHQGLQSCNPQSTILSCYHTIIH